MGVTCRQDNRNAQAAGGPGCECIPLPGRASTRPRRLLLVLTHCIVIFTRGRLDGAGSPVDTSVPLAHPGAATGWRRYCKTLRRRRYFVAAGLDAMTLQEKKNGTAVAIRR